MDGPKLQRYQSIDVPEGFRLAALRRYTYHRKYVFYDAEISHPRNVDAVMEENKKFEPGYEWQPLFIKED